jgi:hypothetical protein
MISPSYLGLKFVALEEVDDLTFLFGAQVGPDLYGLGRVL